MEMSKGSPNPLLNQKLVNGGGCESGTEQLLEVQAHMWNPIFNFINFLSPYCATQLGILDYPRPCYTHHSFLAHFVIANLPNQNPRVFCLMCILAHSNFFRLQKLNHQDEEGGYVLIDACKLLLKDNLLSLDPFLLAMINPLLTHSWHYLSTWSKNDDPTPLSTFHGKTL